MPFKPLQEWNTKQGRQNSDGEVTAEPIDEHKAWDTKDDFGSPMSSPSKQRFSVE
jgi:hypothetical protein